MIKKNSQLLCLLAFPALMIIAAGQMIFPERCFAENEDVYKKLIIFSDVVDEIEKNYVDPVETETLIEKAVEGMVKSLDPHSTYLDSDAYESLRDDTRGEFSGIGVVLTIKDDILTVISPIEGTPAFRAGIKEGDVIIKVNGESTHEMSIGEAVNKIKGKKGTALTLTILRKGGGQPIDIELVRDDIPLESVKSIMAKPGYGYVSITNFNENTSKDLKEALVKLEVENGAPLSGLVVDLRNNPGGLLQQAVKVSDMFVRDGVIVTIKGRKGTEAQKWKAHDDPDELSCPVVVIINGGSASASEIVAGALQDHKRALILGTTSFGKGSVQNIKPLGDGSALKLTVARYFTPSGRSIQAEGIKPDIELAFERFRKGDGSKRLKEKDLKNHLGSSFDDAEDREGGEPTQLSMETGIVRAGKLNMRSSPDTSGSVIGVLKKDMEVVILKHMDNMWLKISHKGRIGYIKGSSLYIEIVEEDAEKEIGYGELTVDRLMRDNQVKRALELLVSHTIFSGIMD